MDSRDSREPRDSRAQREKTVRTDIHRQRRLRQ